MTTAPAKALAPNRVELTWCPPPSGGVLGPDARKTPYHHFAIFEDGRRRIGGTYGSGDEARALAYVLARAAEAGIGDPQVILKPRALA